MIPSIDVLKNYDLDDTTKSIWGISRSYDNVFLDRDVICVLDPRDHDGLLDGDLLWKATSYIHVIAKMLDEWRRIRVTRPSMEQMRRYREELDESVADLDGAGGDASPIGDLNAALSGVLAVLEERVFELDEDPGERKLFSDLVALLELFDEKIGIVKAEGEARVRMVHQVALMYVLTLTRRGECAVLANEQGYEGLITIPFRNLLAREVDHPDSPLNVLRGSRVTAILPDDRGKFRRNFVSSWVSPNDRVFVTVGGVEDVEARDRVLELVRAVASDLEGLGYSGEKYRLDISTDRDTLGAMFDELIKRIPRPVEGQPHVGIESVVPVWEKVAEICGVLGYHGKRDEALRLLGSIRGRRFALEIDRLKARMDEVTDEPDWHSDPERIDEFQRIQKEILSLLDRRKRR
jgi:hypothetical protein